MLELTQVSVSTCIGYLYINLLVCFGNVLLDHTTKSSADL